jgi:hypothetical protein
MAREGNYEGVIMLSVEYFVVCRSVSVDVHTDEITLAGVLEDVVLEEGDFAIIPRAVAVGVWNLDAQDMGVDHQAVLRVTRPGDPDVADFRINLTKDRQRIRVLFAVFDIPLEQPGDLVFELRLNDSPSAHHRVYVHPPGNRLPSGAGNAQH